MSDIEITRMGVALTDVIVFIACMVALFLLRPLVSVRRNLHRSYLNLFLSVGLAALFGAIHHQFFEEATSFIGTIPRFVTMVSIGYAAMNLWLIAAELILSGATLFRAQKLFRILMYMYIVLVVIYEHQFWVAIVFYLPAVLFFLGGASYRLIKYNESLHKWAVAGLLVTVVAAAIQALGIQLVPVYLNHSSFYHLVQLPGIYLLYRHAKESANWLDSQ